jgi:hypothetical protein
MATIPGSLGQAPDPKHCSTVKQGAIQYWHFDGKIAQIFLVSFKINLILLICFNFYLVNHAKGGTVKAA